MGGCICLQRITRGMREATATTGMFNYLRRDYERIQLRPVEDLLAGRGFDTPSKVQTRGWTKQAVMPL
ncbi:MAG: hypothetical protein FJ035_05025 [Chloroflexi bacterium]|nr:hypothetical protein [Chloroflexota bacterium]